MSNLAPTSDRMDALREYLYLAEDKEKARAWILECLDPEIDAELLDYLTTEYFQLSTKD